MCSGYFFLLVHQQALSPKHPFNMKVFFSVAALVLLELMVGALPVDDEAIVSTIDNLSMQRRVPEKWTELDSEERLWVLDAVEKLAESAVGPIYVSLGVSESPLRSSKNETYLFDAYGLLLPDNTLPYVLLSPAVPSNPADIPPPFQSPPLNNIQVRKGTILPVGESEKAVKEITQISSFARIPPIAYYHGVPVLIPRALGKIAIKMSAINRMIEQRELHH